MAESSAAEPRPVWTRADPADISMPPVPVQVQVQVQAAVIAALLISLQACAAAAAIGGPEPG